MLQVASEDDNAALAAKLNEARRQLLAVYADLPAAYWECERFPYFTIANPPLWELAHVAWFQEYWCHRHDFALDRPVHPAALQAADDWVDSRKVAHTVRWLPGHPSREAVDAYLSDTLARTLATLANVSPEQRYPFRLALYHETMHVEALLMTLQTLGLPFPAEFAARKEACLAADRPTAEVSVAGGTHTIGSEPEPRYFVFDNERHAHARNVPAFRIDSKPVTQRAFRDFAERAYDNDGCWSESGLKWKAQYAGRREKWLSQPAANSDELVCRVSAYEAEAYCKAAGRRLPTEFEWEVAAQQNLLGDTGRVWEWTASDFLPYAGFTQDPYREYSQPWFGDHRVLKGGSWATHPDLKRPAFRNFYLPERSDVFAGFRTCAV